MSGSLQQAVVIALLQAGMIIFPGSDWFLMFHYGSLVAIGLGLDSFAT